MTLAIIDMIAIIMVAAGTISAFSVLYAKFIKPVKKVLKQVEDNAEAIKKLEENKVLKQVEENAENAKRLEAQLDKMKAEKIEEHEFSLEVRGIILESLVAILDGLEQTGANHSVTTQKAKLIKFMSSQVGGKKRK